MLTVNTLSFIGLCKEMTTNLPLFLTVILTLGVVFVNGWTDAPNAIATCIGTRSLKVRPAIMMSAVCNFFGVLVMTVLNSKVAETITKMVRFGDGSNPAADAKVAMVALCAALLSIVIYSVAASMFGIPTSESHSLIAGLTGAAVAVRGFEGIVMEEWIKVLKGIVLSVGLGLGLGYLVCKIVVVICRKKDRRKTNKFFQSAQIAGAAAMSFMHGAQDGQKFIGVLLLGVTFCQGKTGLGSDVVIPVWLMILCSVVMGVGTSVGGEKIIKSVGMDMVKMEKFQGFSADFAGALCLLFANVFGFPVSTTHTKTCAIMGAGAVKRLSAINLGVVKNMVLTWIFTFPGCGLISYVMAKIFFALF